MVTQANALKGDSGLGQDNSSGCSGGDGEKRVALKQYLGRKKNSDGLNMGLREREVSRRILRSLTCMIFCSTHTH